jgi:mRNA interferase MazF
MFQFGDILLVSFPFTNATNVKKRPALVLLDNGDSDVLVARISTQTDYSTFDINLEDWRSEGLLTVSYARLYKLATLSDTLIDRKLGQLSANDKLNIAQKLIELFDFT